MSNQPARPGYSKGYLNHEPNLNDRAIAYRQAVEGSARLLDALLHYYERRAAA